MKALREMFYMRKEEIECFIGFLLFLEEKAEARTDCGSEFSGFFNPGSGGIKIPYYALINILKSNVSLMIYNIVEYTVLGLISIIYREISNNKLSYINVSDDIQKIWREAIFQKANDDEAKFNTFLRKNEEIVNMIISNSALSMEINEILPRRNFGGKYIRKIFIDHGMKVEDYCPNYQSHISDRLDIIKNKRNELAHGEIGFEEAGREDTINDVSERAKLVTNFLEKIINMVSEYIEKEKYKSKTLDSYFLSQVLTGLKGS